MQFNLLLELTRSVSNFINSGFVRRQFLLLFAIFLPHLGFCQGTLTNGGNHDGTTESGDEDVWSFTADAGSYIILRCGELSGTASYAPRILVNGPNGFSVAMDWGYADAYVQFQASLSGTYSVFVSSHDVGETGTYRLRYFKIPGTITVPSGDEGGALTNGGIHDGITEIGDEDAWSFNVTAGDSVVFRCGEMSGTTDYRPYIRVYGPNGAFIGSDWGYLDAYVTFRATLSGTYTALVGSYEDGESGTYHLHFIKAPGTLSVSPGDQGGSMASGGNYDGVTNMGDEDAWTFSATAGDSVVLRCGETSGTSDYRPFIRVYGPDGALISSDWGYLDAYVTFRATFSGTYTVVVGSYEHGETGTYRLRFIKAPGTLIVPPSDEGGGLASGGNYDGTSDMGDEDGWTFSANAGDSVVLRCGETSGTADYRPFIRVYGPNGAVIASDWGYSDAYVTFRATVSGTHTAVIGSYERGETGTYRLRFIKAPGTLIVPSDDQGGVLANGGNHDGITDRGDEDGWTFSANAGDSVVLRCGETSGTADYRPFIRVYGPNGAVIVSDWGYSDAYVTFRATVSGTHTAVVGSYERGETGTYRLRFIKAPGTLIVPSDDQGGVLANGGNYDGITDRGDEDAWTFTANAGDSVVLRSGETSGTADYRPFIRVFGPNGAFIVSDWDYSDAYVTFRAAVSGTYIAVVGSYERGESGTYRLRFIKAPGAIIVPLGDQGGALTNGLAHLGTTDIGDEDPWTFNAWAGDSVVLRCGETTGTSDYYPRILVFGPNGILVAWDWDYSEAYLQFQTTISGKYTVVVGSYDEGGNGAYRLTYHRTMTMRSQVIGSGTVTPASVATVGSTQTFTATPFPGYIVSEWRVDGIRRQIGGNTFTLTNIRDNHLITAVFRPLIKFYWQNTNGWNAEWRMNGTNFITSTALPSLNVAWKMVGQSDFNSDGSVDLLYQNNAGQMLLRSMSGTVRLRDNLVRFGQAAPTGWQVKALSDLNNDGQTDFLFQTATNRLAAWFMNKGTNYLGSTLMSPHTTGWKVVGMADFNGDTKKDLLWQNSFGNVAVWMMNGRTNLGPVNLFSNRTATAGWTISALADLDFNGQKDIVAQNGKGQVQAWLMNRTNFLKTVLLRNGATNSAPGWQLKGPK